MKKRNISLPLSILLLMVVVALIAKIHRDKTTFSQNENTNKGKLSETADLLVRQIRYNRRYENADLSFSVADSTGKQIPFSQLTKDGPRLFFRFTEQSCSSCFEAELKSIDTLSSSIGKSNVIFLISYESNHAIQLLKRNYHLQVPIYNVKEQDLGSWDIEKLNVPYSFLSDPYGISNFFIPEKDLPLISTLFYNNVSKYFEGQFRQQRHLLDSKFTSVSTSEKTLIANNLHLHRTTDFKIRLKNTGAIPLMIAKVSTSCECMISSYPKYPVAEHDSAELTIRLTPEEPGRLVKSVDIFANTKDSPIHFEINGTIK